MGPTANATGGTPNDWERWRGRVDAKLSTLCGDIKHFERSCEVCRAGQFEGLSEIHKRITALEVKVARMAGGWALIGSLVGGGLALVAQHLIGG